MQNINSNTVLKVTSIINAITGGFGMTLGLSALVFGGFAVTGAAGADLAAGGVFAMGAGVLAILSAIFDFAFGIFGIRAANGTGSIDLAWTMAVIALILTVLSAIGSFATGMLGFSVLVRLAFVGAAFWAANDIKNGSVASVNA